MRKLWKWSEFSDIDWEDDDSSVFEFVTNSAKTDTVVISNVNKNITSLKWSTYLCFYFEII